jgi:cysteinyl-tRNA synthetase
MAKSTGNMTLVGDLLADHRPAAVRLMIVNRVWHQPWEYADGEIRTAEAALDALYEAAGRTHDSAEADDQVVSALLDDLDVPRALELATAEGGSAARLLVETLKLR